MAHTYVMKPDETTDSQTILAIAYNYTGFSSGREDIMEDAY